MGLAQKLAASQGASYGAPSSTAGAAAQPSHGQYQAYPGGYSGQSAQYPPQQSGYPPQGYQQYGAGPTQQATPQQIGVYKQALQECIQEKRLHSIIAPNDPRLDQWANRAASQVEQLCAQWRVPKEVGQGLVKLALFDIILYIDDSGSMQFDEGGERIKDLKLILARVAYAASLFDDDGVSIRFMNSSRQDDNVRSEPQIEAIVDSVGFKGLTPMGTSLQNKVLAPMVIKPAKEGTLRKPVLVITITDGQPAGEAQTALFDTIRNAATELGRTRYGPGAVSFQFAQVGNDQQATAFLAKLDNDPEVGSLVDCTSNYENEQVEMMKFNQDLTPELWLTKLLMGAIDSSYDTKDEQGSRPQGGQSYGAPPPAGQYGAPASYGQQQGSYPPQQQQQYNYNQQQGGYPPQQQQQYGQGQPYNRPPPPGQPGAPAGYGQQHGTYPPQQQQQQYGYGQPPAQPRY
ncbi:MAG: transcription factor [Lasallia pustulata]|uniref:Transcription factor n=1 Tax=Lasallia pustulata TaxID=136370 RepID=A0A5M8PGL6_9LECA|nr:MAG: transcription factor [Lasallia pustulata]